MNSENIFEMINMYFDGELKKQEETFLFSKLSGNDEAREYFKSSSALKNIMHSEMQVFPDALEERILRSISDKNEKSVISFMNRNIYSLVSYAVTIILIAVSFYFYSLSNNYENQLNATAQQINTQNKLINMLYNSMPSTEVRTTVDYKVIVTDEL